LKINVKEVRDTLRQGSKIYYPTSGQDHLHATVHITMTCKSVTCSWM